MLAINRFARRSRNTQRSSRINVAGVRFNSQFPQESVSLETDVLAQVGKAPAADIITKICDNAKNGVRPTPKTWETALSITDDYGLRMKVWKTVLSEARKLMDIKY
eukprot:TRINITY_DN1321_c0_g2_i1.p1 TRINITY_DN1321_c0_g2~~TRINITY_DN1321_c0_g2_i1.p1  ORF type:complete len:106 (+),score=24.43 TRINITY_DN1321_c0_g2_i1:53-370(+)